MNDPIDENTPGRLDVSDVITMVFAGVIVLGSLALDAKGVWTLPQNIKFGIILSALAVLMGEKGFKALKP